MNNNFCGNCGKELYDVNFCSNCGEKVREVEHTPQQQTRATKRTTPGEGLLYVSSILHIVFSSLAVFVGILSLIELFNTTHTWGFFMARRENWVLLEGVPILQYAFGIFVGGMGIKHYKNSKKIDMLAILVIINIAVVAIYQILITGIFTTNTHISIFNTAWMLIMPILYIIGVFTIRANRPKNTSENDASQ